MQKQALAGIAVFFLLSLLLLSAHEPWRDEAQAWLIARDSPSVSALVRWMGYEGSPALWHLLLYPLARAGLPYASMSALHHLVALAAAALFVRFAPFPVHQKILAILGYYFLYEYNAVARNYALTPCILFAIAALYRHRFTKPVPYALLIVLLANANVHSLVIAAVLAGVYAVELRLRQQLKRAAVPVLLIGCGCLLSAWQVLPPADLQPDTAGWHLDLSPRNIGGIPHAVLGAFFPVPQLKVAFWNSRLPYTLTPGLAVLGAPLFLLSLCYFARKPAPFAAYLLSCAGLFAIFFFKHRGSLRHHGLIFVLFLFCLWIAAEYRDAPRFCIPSPFASGTLHRAFTAILCCQVAAASVALYYELRYDFSAGKRAAAFLRENNLAGRDVFVAGYPAFAAEPVLPYLPDLRSTFYYPEFDARGSFVVWNRTYAAGRALSRDEILRRIDRAARDRNGRPAVLILNEKIEGAPSGRYRLVARFAPTVVPEESLYIYRTEE